MATLDFFGASRNLYHTLNERNVSVNGGMIHGSATITGFSPSSITAGDVLNINDVLYQVESVKRRDHRGVFSNPKDAINSFFEAETKFTKVIPTK